MYRRHSVRVLAGIIGVAGVIYGGLLSWPGGIANAGAADGLAIASVFAVGLITLVFAFTGVTPTSVKFKDVEVALDNAREEGKASGGLKGFEVAAEIREAVDANELKRDEVEAALKTALSTDGTLDVSVPATRLMTPKLSEADAHIRARRLAQKLAGPR